MGPAATADLFGKIIGATAAGSDPDHLRVLIDSNPAIPNRTDAILSAGADPGPALIETARGLEKAGADLLVMPCNTAHWYLERIRAATEVPILDMIAETARSLAETSDAGMVGILATSGTLATGLYARALESVGRTWIVPDTGSQARLMRAIHLVKSGEPEQAAPLVVETLLDLVSRGAQVIVLGCTELPIALVGRRLPVPAVDPTMVLARAAVAAAGGVLRSAEATKLVS